MSKKNKYYHVYVLSEEGEMCAECGPDADPGFNVCEDRVSAECMYFRLVAGRVLSQAKDSIIVQNMHVDYGSIGISSVYSLAENAMGPRERLESRYMRIWATLEEGWIPPHHKTIEGLLRFSKCSLEVFEGIYGEKVVRKWLSGKKKIPYQAWRSLLRDSGVLFEEGS